MCILHEWMYLRLPFLLLLTHTSGGSKISRRRGVDLVGEGVDSRGSYISKILYVKTKELGPLGGARAGRAPLDPPMHTHTHTHCTVSCKLCLSTHLLKWVTNPLVDLGGVPGTRSLRVQILSFWHTKFLKCNCLRRRRPPLRGLRPPAGNPISATLIIKCKFQHSKLKSTIDFWHHKQRLEWGKTQTDNELWM